MSTSISRRRFSLALLALALLFPIVLLAPAAVPPVRAADAAITFEGGGWGHGVGLSQYGAYGMALIDGADAATILQHYYTDVSLKTLGSGIPGAEPLWVNILDSVSSTRLRPTAITGDGTNATVTHDGTAFEAHRGDAIRVRVTGVAGGQPTCRIAIADAISEGSCFADITWDGELDAPTSRMTIENSALGADDPAAPCTNPDWNAIPTLFRPCSYDRGELHIRPAGIDRFHVVLELDVDAYVEGISEMPYYWANPADGPNGTAALEAQAIAARSYAISRQIARGNPEDANCWCDVVDTAADQRYVGWGHTGIGSDAWIAAARGTAGVVLTHPSVGNGTQPITAYYGSSSYGVTESGIDGFAQDIAYLQSVDDHWAGDPAVRNVYSPWAFTLDGTEIADRLDIGGRTIVSADVSACSDAGAALQVRFIDDDGGEHLRAARDLRGLLGLRSPQITSINGVAACDATPPTGADAPLLVPGRTDVDDDRAGDSIGNGDGVAQCGETLELFTSVVNEGGPVGEMIATITGVDDSFTVVHNTTSPLAAEQPGGPTTNTNDWDIAVDASVPDGHRGEITIAVADGDGRRAELTFALVIECLTQPPSPVLSVSAVTVDDGVLGDSVGNNDRAAQCRETIELYVELTNSGAKPIEGVVVTIESLDDRVRLLFNESSPYPTVAPGSSAENSNDWDLSLGGVFGEDYVAAFRLVVSVDGEEQVLTTEVPVECPALPGDAAPGDVMIDDGPTGDSIGNNDGIAQCGETIELRIPFTHSTGTDVTDLVVTLVSKDPALTIVHNAESAYPVIGDGQTATNTDDWDIAIGPVPDGHVALIGVRYEMNGWRGRYNLGLPISCDEAPTLYAASTTVDDGVLGDSVGNNNKTAQCGELIELYVELENAASADLSSFVATLTTDDPYVTLLYNDTSEYPPIDAGGSAENRNDWDLQVGDGFEDRHTAVFTLTVDALDVSIDVPVSLRCAS